MSLSDLIIAASALIVSALLVMAVLVFAVIQLVELFA